MKQVIVRIRDCRPTYIKTIDKYYFHCISSYKEKVVDCVKQLLPGQEIYIKIGNLYCKFISYEDLLQNSLLDDSSIEEELYNNMIEDYALNYYLSKYLPLY